MKILTILSIVSSIVYSAPKDIEAFKTCYALFTGERVKLNNSLFVQVINGQKTGVRACTELIAKANFNSSDTIRKINSTQYDEEAAKVLRQFNFLHRSFYEVPSYMSLPEVTNVGDAPDVFDENVPAYYWSHNLFKTSKPVRDILKDNFSFRAIRYSTIASTRRSRNARTGTELTLHEGWNPPLAETGTLVGIKRDTMSFSNNKLSSSFSQYQGTNANLHFGGGVLGSNVYFLSNAGRYGIRERSTGGIKLFRRWSKHVLSDFLCRDVPALRIGDVEAEVQEEAAFPFRKSASCMQCHSTMDPMAGNIRNLHTVGFSTPGRPFITFRAPTEESAREDGLLPVQAEDNNFYKRPPVGRIMYRSYDGTLVKRNTSSLQDLGDFMANTNDFYACTAKKYYKFLTGVNADLSDQGDPVSPKLNSTELYHRNKVISLGMSLKNHQNIQTLIKDILSSDSFMYPTKRH